ncbi:MAG: diaminopimelate decarboxylase [Candidatus Firestonebacteria bacterium]
MHYFYTKDKYLYCEGLKVADITVKYGTPLYLYSHRTISEHFTKIDDAFSAVPHLICYALKANSNLAIVKTLQKLGAGADIVSGGELYKALKAGIPAKKIVYAGVGKTEAEIEYALSKDILMFNIESVPEAEMISKVAGRLRETADIALRINPDVDAKTHHYITTGKKENKFGLNINLARKLFLKINGFKNLNVVGVHIHIGSQITTSGPYVKAIKKVIKLIGELRSDGIIIKSLNIGGGLGIVYKDENPSTPKKFAEKILPLIKPLGIRIIMEPGRFIVGNAGILVARVSYIKKGENKKFIILDAGMNDLIRPSLYDAYHKILPVTPVKGSSKADIVGPICESGDFFGKGRVVSNMKPGDYIAVMSAGAYGFSMASNYNARRRPVEVMVKGKKSFLVKKRESFEDLVRGEIMPEGL